MDEGVGFRRAIAAKRRRDKADFTTPGDTDRREAEAVAIGFDQHKPRLLCAGMRGPRAYFARLFGKNVFARQRALPDRNAAANELRLDNAQSLQLARNERPPRQFDALERLVDIDVERRP